MTPKRIRICPDNHFFGAVLQLLLSEGANLEARSTREETALIEASQMGHIQTVQVRHLVQTYQSNWVSANFDSSLHQFLISHVLKGHSCIGALHHRNFNQVRRALVRSWRSPFDKHQVQRWCLAIRTHLFLVSLPDFIFLSLSPVP